MQVYLGLKPKRKTESASAASSGSAAAAPPAPEDSVGRAIDLLNAEFFSTGTQLKHVFTSAQVALPRPPSLSCSAKAFARAAACAPHAARALLGVMHVQKVGHLPRQIELKVNP